MSLTLAAILVGLGGIGGFAAGLLGFGGGVLMFPLLYYVPPMLGIGSMSAKMVSATVASQVFFSTISGGIAHFRSGHVSTHLALIAGSVSAASAFAGAITSKWVSERFLLLLFGIVTVLVTIVMFLPAPDEAEEDRFVEASVARLPLMFFSFASGIVIGFLGAGNFIFVPVLIYVLRVPTRIAIGSSLVIAMMNTASGFLGKLISGQLQGLETALVVIGALLGAQAGERVHRLLSSVTLRKIYATMVTLIALRVWLTIFGFDQKP
jgi:uncharacterized protein